MTGPLTTGIGETRCAVMVSVLEGALTAVSPIDGSELRLDAPAVWTHNVQPFTFRADEGTVFSVVRRWCYA